LLLSGRTDPFLIEERAMPTPQKSPDEPRPADPTGENARREQELLQEIPATQPSEERGERLDTGKTIAQGGKDAPARK
jgi:hypothetical protein